MTVTPDGIFEVSRRLRDDYENGRVYYGMHGGRVQMPRQPEDRPDLRLLDWHARDRFLG